MMRSPLYRQRLSFESMQDTFKCFPWTVVASKHAVSRSASQNVILCSQAQQTIGGFHDQFTSPEPFVVHQDPHGGSTDKTQTHEVTRVFDDVSKQV